ncbi:hypothetical protein Fot_19902 [Forsythia ovata]|uniref:Uncharacterized protein n=1 Tax=Forsythia ovata TaxID=205694 RepID=A0ABD1VMD0_9LAMI
MAADVGSFSKTVGSNSSRRNPMSMRSIGGRTWVRNAPSWLSISAFLLPDCLELLGDGAGPAENDVEGTSDVTAGTGKIRRELPTVVSGVCKTVTPRVDDANSTRDRMEISSTTPYALS